MPGHMGNERKTVRNLKVMRVNADENLLLIRGALPGPTGSFVLIKKVKK